MTCQTETCQNKTRGGRKLCQPCFRTIVFLPRRPLYDIWYNMLRRCHDPKHPRYADWGGRGVKVCERWRKDYFAFQADVGDRPSKHHQIDRIKNNGNYEPKNVEWVLAAKNSAYGRRRVRSDNTTGTAGVSYHKKINRYTATITVATRRIYLGCYVSKSAAIHARQNAEKSFIGMRVE